MRVLFFVHGFVQDARIQTQGRTISCIAPGPCQGQTANPPIFWPRIQAWGAGREFAFTCEVRRFRPCTSIPPAMMRSQPTYSELASENARLHAQIGELEELVRGLTQQLAELLRTPSRQRQVPGGGRGSSCFEDGGRAAKGQEVPQ